jgi:2-polyprenyl-3-methyl-5-hydroxy-6-metoxy-1,4-benzoquinol methylase
MPDFAKRSEGIEIMDDLNCTGHILDQTLRELEIINKWLGGNKITISALANLLQGYSAAAEVTIVDLGCGGGDMLRIIDGWGKRKNLRLKLIGIDANPYIVDFAKRNLKDYPHIQFQTLNIFSEDFQNQKYDIVVGTLFYHHFSNDQLVQFFCGLKHQIRIGFILNDIHRHWLAYYSIKLLTRTFSKSAMVKYDAPLSVLRAFKKEEVIQILETAGFKEIFIRWKWAFRWQVIVKASQ